ncbi:hypothetical protein EGW08_007172 [Elysia chlorotica]|uniref:Uncharacterized protein n=1 Tax=Elysia chlorotica TaxID=188477 RepID=A0A433TU26_ELYCH|nr:hypothetical protein EGW08_007172 [Elysia chlorotica]
MLSDIERPWALGAGTSEHWAAGRGRIRAASRQAYRDGVEHLTGRRNWWGGECTVMPGESGAKNRWALVLRVSTLGPVGRVKQCDGNNGSEGGKGSLTKPGIHLILQTPSLRWLRQSPSAPWDRELSAKSLAGFLANKPEEVAISKQGVWVHHGAQPGHSDCRRGRPGCPTVHCLMTHGQRQLKPPDPDRSSVALTCNTCPGLRPRKRLGVQDSLTTIGFRGL